mgnify:CR=1 FL=1
MTVDPAVPLLAAAAIIAAVVAWKRPELRAPALGALGLALVALGVKGLGATLVDRADRDRRAGANRRAIVAARKDRLQLAAEAEADLGRARKAEAEVHDQAVSDRERVRRTPDVPTDVDT